MALLYLAYGPQSGVTASIARALSERGLEVFVANPAEGFLWQVRPGSKVPNLRPAAVRAFLAALRAHRGNWKPFWLHTEYAFEHLSRRAGALVRRLRPDHVIQAGVLFAPGRYLDVPYHLYLDHTRAISERYAPVPGIPPPLPDQPSWRARERQVYRNAEGIFTMSAFVERSLVADYGVDPRRVHVVGAGPNVEPDPRDLEGPREKAILFVGRNFLAKGGATLLDAFARVRREHADAQLWIVASSAPARLPDGAVFHGLLGKEALGRLYARAAVFALPTHREAFGLSFVEAMTFGLPVIASRIEAIPEIVSAGETGALVPPGDAAALARALGQLLRDPVRARLLGAAARVRALQRFRWELAAARMLAVLRPERTAAEKAPGASPQLGA